MKTYTIHLLRHALTKGNLEGRYIGHTDEPLCTEGIKQLEEMKKQYDYPETDVVFTSSLLRCKQTAELLYPGKNAIEMRGLDECDFGEFENHTAAELAPYDEFKDWLSGGADAKPLNGESNEAFSLRVTDCFIKIVDGMIKTGTRNAVLLTHGGVIMAILSAFGLPDLPMTEWLCPSGCGYTVRITPSVWSRTRKIEVIREAPSEPLTSEQEARLWDYYEEVPEDDDFDYGDDINE